MYLKTMLKISFNHYSRLYYYRKLKRSYRNSGYLAHDMIFIHIPKAAGTALQFAMFGRLAGLGHVPAERYAKIYGLSDFHSAFKFAFVRHPFDRFVSAYEYLMQGGKNSNDLLFRDEVLHKYSNFEDFVLHGYASDERIRNHTHFIPQHRFVNIDGIRAVDFVGKVENIKQDFEYIKSILGFESELSEINIRDDRRNYLEYFTNPDVEHILFQSYKEDFSSFGYNRPPG